VTGWWTRWLGRDARPLRAARWVVVDCETAGLDPGRDALLAIAAVAVRGGAIALGESHAAILRQEVPSAAANILVHGIGGDAQRAGRAPEEALRAFAAFLGRDLAVAFHAPFDASALRRAAAGMHGLSMPARWLDLARLAPALFPGNARSAHALDDWLAAFGIEVEARHDALHDAFAAAQLLLVLLAEAERQGVRDVTELHQLAGSGARWLGRS
jgi:DNA polymerase-3 subunit epsilon